MSGTALAEGLAAFCNNGGPLQQCGDDMIDVPEPSQVMDLGASKISLKHCALLIASLADSSKRQSTGLPQQTSDKVATVAATVASSGAVVVTGLMGSAGRSPDLLTLDALEAAFAGFAERSDPALNASAMGVAQQQQDMLPWVWCEPNLPAALAVAFALPPPTVDSNSGLETSLLQALDCPVKSERAVGLSLPPALAWRDLAYHLICTLVPSLPTTAELADMTRRLRPKSTSVAAAADGTTVGPSITRMLISKTDLQATPFWFDLGQAALPSSSSSTAASSRGGENIARSQPMQSRLSAAVKNLYVLS